MDGVPSTNEEAACFLLRAAQRQASGCGRTSSVTLTTIPLRDRNVQTTTSEAATLLLNKAIALAMESQSSKTLEQGKEQK